MSNTIFCRIFQNHLQPAVITLGVLVATTALGDPTLPTIPPNLFNVTNYGAVGDGVTISTIAISNAIVAAGNAGGGTVEIPAAAGAYLCGPLLFRSSVNLQIDTNATLKMLPYGTWPGGSTPPDFIVGSSLHDVEISGFGTIDGSGTATGWWQSPTLPTSARPYMISLNTCQRVLIQQVTLKNAPKMHISLKNKGGNITILGITINTPASPNTDGIDLVGTNCLVQDCTISDGDDNIALGTSSANTPTAQTTISHCTFGIGHGVSIGSNTAGGVSNLTVINCTFNNTDYGIRMKSDNATSGSSGAGGTSQNLFYYNIGMTNIKYGPIVIYSYYDEYGTPVGISPSTAASQTVGNTNIPIWRNIIISNVTATVSSSGTAGVVWGRIESQVSNIFLSHLNITAPRTFDVYNVDAFQCVDSQFTITSGAPTFTLFNADVTISNSTPGAPTITFDGLTSTNSLALYQAPASMIAGDAFGANPITLAACTLADNTSLTVPNSTVFNFTLGTNIAEVTAQGNLTVNNTLNITAGDGFGAGTYTLFAYAGVFFGTPVLGTTPPGYSYSITNPPGLIQLLVQAPLPPPPPVFSSISATVNGLVMSGSGGTTNGAYYVLVSTNVALPRNQWAPIATNYFDGSGHFIFTNAINPNSPQTFYLLQIP
jgi:polygalacturonase